MDPNATLERLLKALRDRDGDEACEAATDLINWLDRGGFEPEDLQACIDWHENNRDRFRDTDTDRAFDRLLGSFAQNQWRPRSGKTPADEACEAAEDLIELIDQGAPPPRTLPGCLRIIAGEDPGERPNPAGGGVVRFRELASGGEPRDNPAKRPRGDAFKASLLAEIAEEELPKPHRVVVDRDDLADDSATVEVSAEYNLTGGGLGRLKTTISRRTLEPARRLQGSVSWDKLPASVAKELKAATRGTRLVPGVKLTETPRAGRDYQTLSMSAGHEVSIYQWAHKVLIPFLKKSRGR